MGSSDTQSTVQKPAETPLERRLKRMITTSGPIDLASYMTLCLSDPAHGYYTQHTPLGAAGDFTTAPEISQLFGELLGIWMVAMWLESGKSRPFHLVELGPGRGTLMRDMIRSISSHPRANEALTVHLVEISPSLQVCQKQALRDSLCPVQWHHAIDSLPSDAPLFIIANEFFDCLPIHQWVLKGQAWHERVVGLNDEGQLVFGLGPIRAFAPEQPVGSAKDGAILEKSPASKAMMAQLARLLGQQGGAGLFIDYGYLSPNFGDTFQAIHRHTHTDPLIRPGLQDLTAHVNFQALRDAASAELAQCGSTLQAMLPITQGDFLLNMGLLERAGQLGTGKSPKDQQDILDAVARLAGPDAMGDLFKCLAIMPRDCPLPPMGNGV